jgi:hypothetical protein|tara:strand:+ start:5274 stop:5528 length:255 start_codon:yes stop_codon:yes gene_type:complete
MMNNDFLAVAESHYKAIIDKQALTMNIYMNNSVGVGEHPQIFDEFVAAFEKYSDAVSSFELIQKLKSQSQEQEVQMEPKAEDES